jgi:hypothetical protein
VGLRTLNGSGAQNSEITLSEVHAALQTILAEQQARHSATGRTVLQRVEVRCKGHSPSSQMRHTAQRTAPRAELRRR